MPKKRRERKREQRAEGLRAADRKPDWEGRPVGLVTRKAINWRIPIEYLDRVDAYRKGTGQDRTSVVVQALAEYLKRRDA